MVLDAFLSGVRKTVLPNGLTLLTAEHARGGVVAITTWVRAGYFHEPDEVAGMAHLFEHMFFKGSKHFPGAEEIAQHVSALGGVTNAGTIYDSTNYYFVLPKEGFVKGMEIQADAILNPLFDAEELKKESEVVIEESNRKLDNPSAVATERMFAVAFREHRIRRWRIGSDEVLRNIRRDDLLAFFETLYRPANIIVGIAGDISHEEALAVAERTFGRLPEGELRKEGGPPEPPQSEFRFGQSTADVSQSYSVMGWHTPGEGHDDEAAIDLLAAVLAGGRSTRLYRKAVGPGAANSIVTFNNVYEDVGIFTLRGTFDDANLEEVEKRIMIELERMKAHGPTEFELALAKNRIEAAFIFELEDVLGQSQALSYFESRGSYLDIDGRLKQLQAVTADDVRRVAAEYLSFENMTVYHYRPSDSAPSSREAVEERLKAAVADADLEPPEELELPADAERVSRATGDHRPIQRFILSNGITLFVRESGGTPTVSVSIGFRGGCIRENSSNAGITQLMARSMRRGTATRSGEEIDRELEFLGTQLGIHVAEDFFGFGIDVVDKYFSAAVEILADVVSNPTFPSEGIEEEKHLQFASIRRALDSSGERPFQLFMDLFYGNHPYALPGAGFITSIETLEQRFLRAWWEENVVADGALLVVVGDVIAEEVFVVAERLFGSLGKSRSLPAPVPAVRPPTASLEVIESRDRKQTAIVIGFPTVPPQHDDWTVLRLLQDVASGLAGTFFAELRGRRSLAYQVFAGDSSREQFGAFVGYIATEASKEQQAREGLLQELRRLGTDGVTQADLDRAKSYLAGSMKIRLQTNSAQGAEISRNYLFGLGLDFTDHFLERVRSITLDEIREVAKKYLSQDNYVVATLRGKS